MPRVQVLLLEGRDAMPGCVAFTSHLLLSQQLQAGREFLYIDLPVAAAFEHAAERDDGREDRMPMPASRQVPYLRPWIWIQDVVSRRAYAAISEQAPVVDQVGADAQAILRNRMRPLCVARDAISGLIHTDDKMIREFCCQVEGGQADAATGIEDQRFAAGRLPARHAVLEGAAIVGGNRFLERVPGVPLNLRMQLGMGIGLSADDEMGIRVHRDEALWKKTKLCLHWTQGPMQASKQRLNVSSGPGS